MIQRIQSVYLFLIIIILMFMMFIPLGELQIDTLSFTLLANKYFANEEVSSISFLPLLIYLIILAFYTGVVLFTFKNRVLQIKLAKLNGILLAILIAVVVMSADYVMGNFENSEGEMTVNYGIGTYLSFIPLILNYLAIKRIRKDEELVRSADRLR